MANESGKNEKTILICDLIAGEWQKSCEITQIKGYCSNKRKSPYTTIVSMIAYGDGKGGDYGYNRLCKLGGCNRTLIFVTAGIWL